METERILTEKNGLVWTIIINRPDVRNAVDRQAKPAMIFGFHHLDNMVPYFQS